MIVLYIFFPFLTIFLYSCMLLKIKRVPKKLLWLLSFMLAFYLGLLNSTKELLGDFAAYHLDFTSVPLHDLYSFVFLFGKEPVYTIFTYLSYYILGGNWNLYVIFITSVNYLLISFCLIKLSECININYKNTVVALFIMAFFFQEFAAIGNIMRQAPAQALAMTFLTLLYLERRYYWWIALCALFTHTSTLPILAIGMIPSISKRFSLKSITMISSLLLVIVGVFFSLESVLSGLPFIGYIYSRANNSDALLGADSWQMQLGLNFFTATIVVILCVMAAYIYVKNRKCATFPGVGVVNINIVLLLMIIVCDNIGAFYLLMRYYFFIYTFQNLLILYYLHQIKLTNNFPRILIMVLFIIYFFYCYKHTIFNYISIEEAILYPTFLFF